MLTSEDRWLSLFSALVYIHWARYLSFFYHCLMVDTAYKFHVVWISALIIAAFIVVYFHHSGLITLSQPFPPFLLCQLRVFPDSRSYRKPMRVQVKYSLGFFYGATSKFLEVVVRNADLRLPVIFRFGGVTVPALLLMAFSHLMSTERRRRKALFYLCYWHSLGRNSVCFLYSLIDFSFSFFYSD